MRPLNVALCQLACHPAISAGHVAYLEEPFLADPTMSSLAKLAALQLDVTALQEACEQQYLAWATRRLTGIIGYMGALPEQPDLVLFPEGAIPHSLLPPLAEFAQRTGCTVLAGTHSPNRTRQARKCYTEVRVEEGHLTKVLKYSVCNVLPVLDQARCRLVPKRALSPFETVIGAAPLDLPQPRPLHIRFIEGDLDILPLICSEALQLPNAAGTYDIVAIPAFDTKPAQFADSIRQLVRNKKIVLFCNDGHFGGTMLHCVIDDRMPNWLRDAFSAGLPTGDLILSTKIDLDARAVEVGTAVPSHCILEFRLAAVVPGLSPHAAVSRKLERIRALTDPAVRRSELESLQKHPNQTPYSQIRIQRLWDAERRGLPTDALWQAIGADCLVEDLPSLEQLEADLAGRCRAALDDAIQRSPRAEDPQVAQALVSFQRRCGSVTSVGSAGAPAATGAARPPAATIGREDESRRTIDAMDNRNSPLFELLGLAQVGKSQVLTKALSESGISSVGRVTLRRGSSLEFLAQSIIRLGGNGPVDAQAPPLELVDKVEFRTSLHALRVLLIENVHELTNREGWLDASGPDFFNALIEACIEAGTSLVVESRFGIPFDLRDPTVRVPLRVGGLPPDAGVRLFDAQLRRVGLESDSVPDSAKRTLVSKLGGHPVAIALAADAVASEGVQAVLGHVAQRKGFYLGYVGRLVQDMRLSDEETAILRVLCAARASVPRGVIAAALPIPTTAPLSELVRLAAVEQDAMGELRIAGILREYYDGGDGDPAHVQSFHVAAAGHFEQRAKVERGASGLSAQVEHEYHARLAKLAVSRSLGLIDGAFATAQECMRLQRYQDARSILSELMRRPSAPLAVVRSASLAAAYCGDFGEALVLARQVFGQNRRDTPLLAELVRIAVTRYQAEEAADELIRMARQSGIEDVSVLVAEGRLELKRGRFDRAERALLRATELTEHNAWPFYYLGRVLVRQGRLDDAIAVLSDGEQFCYKAEVRSRRVLDAIRTELGIAYVFDGQMDLAAQIIEPLMQDERPSPEVIRAFAALSIKRDGVKDAHKALERLQEAKMRDRRDRCQFHLLYGLFYTGIEEFDRAEAEFRRAHAADRCNVFVILKWASALLGVAQERTADGDDSYRQYVRDCARLVRQVLEGAPENQEARNLAFALKLEFADNLPEEIGPLVSLLEA